MTIKQGYGLRHKASGELLGVYTTSNAGGDCCGDESYHLTTSSDIPWMVETKLNASYVRMFTTPWYNAGYETPENSFKPEELEVVKIEIREDVNAEEPDFIPTFAEYMKIVYNTPGGKRYNPGHYKMVMDNCKRHGHEGHYSIYDLERLNDTRAKEKKTSTSQ
jgi:hypothetical protein